MSRTHWAAAKWNTFSHRVTPCTNERGQKFAIKIQYPPVLQHCYGRWWCIYNWFTVPIKKGDFPCFSKRNVKLAKCILFPRSNQPLAAVSDDVCGTTDVPNLNLLCTKRYVRFSRGIEWTGMGRNWPASRQHGFRSLHPRADTKCLPGRAGIADPSDHEFQDLNTSQPHRICEKRFCMILLWVASTYDVKDAKTIHSSNNCIIIAVSITMHHFSHAMIGSFMKQPGRASGGHGKDAWRGVEGTPKSSKTAGIEGLNQWFWGAKILKNLP